MEQSKSCYKFLQKIINLDQKRILEIGAGSGALLKYISQSNNSLLFYSDLSKEATMRLSEHKNLHDLNSTNDIPKSKIFELIERIKKAWVKKIYK